MIPLVLMYLVEKQVTSSTHGRIARSTVWGYEEPENNLELLQQMKMAQQFADYASKAQLIVTTHSPAFYALAAHKCLADRTSSGETQFETTDSERLDERVGLLPFVTPYIKKAMADRDSLMDSLRARAKVIDEPTLLVEGMSDVEIILHVRKVLGMDAEEIKVTAGSGEEGSANHVVNHAVSRAFKDDLKSPTVVLFDSDEAGRIAKAALEQTLGQSRAGRIKILSLGKFKSPALIKLNEGGLSIDFAIEELLPESVWYEVGSTDLERRAIRPDTKARFNRDDDLSYKNALGAKFRTESFEYFLACNAIKLSSKKRFSKLATQKMCDANYIPECLKKLCKAISEHLSK
jgi:predicted ATP-dependent endonuclease of OLD family